MSWENDLEIAIERTKHERFRWLCSYQNRLPKPNDRESYRQLMGIIARGEVQNPAPMQGVISVGDCLGCPGVPLPP